MQVTVKTLRHYEQKGLLMPHEVDEWTGYRYYTVEQMQRLGSIRELQRLGFSLSGMTLVGVLVGVNPSSNSFALI